MTTRTDLRIGVAAPLYSTCDQHFLFESHAMKYLSSLIWRLNVGNTQKSDTSIFRAEFVPPSPEICLDITTENETTMRVAELIKIVLTIKIEVNNDCCLRILW